MKSLIWLFVLMLAAVPAGCGPSAATSPAVTAETSTFPTSGPVLETDNPYEARIQELWDQYGRDPAVFDAVVMAAHLGITVEEAQRRLGVTDAFEGLESRLIAGEPATFGGLWIQQQEPFRIVVAFTANGEETIKKYVPDDLMENVAVRTVTYTYAYLLETQRTFIFALRQAGIRFMSGVYVMDNNVGVTVEDRTELDRLVAEGKLTIPDGVVVKVGGLPVLLTDTP